MYYKIVCNADSLINYLINNEKHISALLDRYLSSNEINDFASMIDRENCLRINKHVIIEKLVNEFNEASFDEDRFKFNERNMTLENKYPQFVDCGTVKEFPSLYQIVNNHFKYYLKRNVKFFSSRAHIIPLIIRSDDIALVYIHDIKSQEIICDAPVHELEGVSLHTAAFSPFGSTEYMNLAIVNLNDEFIIKGKHKGFSQYEHENRMLCNIPDGCSRCNIKDWHDDYNDYNRCKDTYYTFAIDAKKYC